MDVISKDLILLAIEKALLEMGSFESEIVESKLKKNFQKSIEDCLENPIFLKKVLCDLYGEAYKDILSSIDNSFKTLTMDDDLTNFLKVMKG